MGAKDERMLMQQFIDFGFGAYRYPQPAIQMKEKYQRGDFTHVRRAQPVDFFVNGKLNVTFKDGTQRIIFFRIGVEEKTTGGYSFTRSMIDDKSHVKFIEFCRKNCVVPAYIVVFRKYEYAVKFDYCIGNDKPYSLRIEDAYVNFEDMLSDFLRDYIEVYDSYDDIFDEVAIDFRGEESGG